MITVEKALEELNNKGFQIEQVEENKYICYDTGLFGFSEDEDPFIVDGDEIIEIYEQYI